MATAENSSLRRASSENNISDLLNVSKNADNVDQDKWRE